MFQALLVLIAIFCGIPALIGLLWSVHRAMDFVCICHVRRFCGRYKLEVHLARCQPAFDSSGIKTESSVVQLECLDEQKRRRLVLLLATPFGIRKLVSNEEYPASYDEHWRS